MRKNEYNRKSTFLPWIEKYRPKTLKDIVSHSDVTNALKKFIKNKTLPHLLFYGPPGTGKTSSIMACAKELYGRKYNIMTMELNASDDRGIEVVRNRIKQFVTTTGVFNGQDNKDNNMFKLVILDETDAMTEDAQAILRQIMERYTSNARFCIICNYIRKINPALRSRCASFRFSSLSRKSIITKIDEIVEKENINITKKAIDVIIKWSAGDMRKILNVLQSAKMAYNKINDKIINRCLGYPNNEVITMIFKNIMTLPYKTSYNNIYKIIEEEGISLTDIITEIHDILINHILGKTNSLLEDMTDDDIAKILYRMKDIEFNQNTVSSKKIQLGAFISLFYKKV